jgi:hypothetical protein
VDVEKKRAVVRRDEEVANKKAGGQKQLKMIVKLSAKLFLLWKQHYPLWIPLNPRYLDG